MRQIQVILFFTALAAFFVALFFAGQVTGDVLWRAGVAILLADLACVKLWPSSPPAPRG